MSTPIPTSELLPPAHQDGEVNLLVVAAALASQWRLFLATFAIAAVVLCGAVFLLHPKYVAKSSILPQEGHTQADAFASLFSARGPGTLYIGLLKSRSVQDDLVARLHLQQQWNLTSAEAARLRLAAISSFTEAGDGLVTISVKSRSATEAAAIANGYLDSLRALDSRMASAQARETGSFFEQQLQAERAALERSENNLESTQQKTGLVQPETQTNLGLNSIAAIRAQIAMLQVQLAALTQSETDANPEVRNLRSQIAQLQAEEAQLEHGGRAPVGAAPSAQKLPETTLDYQRAQRDVRFHDALVTSLANQGESARLNEDFARSAFQEVDRAVVPERTSWPPRLPFLAVALIAALGIALAVAVLRLVWLRMLRDPENHASLAALRASFR